MRRDPGRPVAKPTTEVTAQVLALGAASASNSTARRTHDSSLDLVDQVWTRMSAWAPYVSAASIAAPMSSV